MTLHDFPTAPAPTPALAGPRPLAALVLRAASRALDRLAARLMQADTTAFADPTIEFYAEAGAPEGALYFDGQLVGYVEGVNRL